VFIFRLVERWHDCVDVPADEIVDGYVAIVAEKHMFFDVSVERISADDIGDYLYTDQTN